MEGKNGADFDRAFIEHAVKDHRKDISKFEKASRDLNDTDLRAFATESLPTLRSHLAEAERIAKSLGVDVNVRNVSEYGDDNAAAVAAAAGSAGAPGLATSSANSSVNRVDIERAPGARVDIDVDRNRDASAESKIEVKTDKGDGKTLGVETKEGDGKILGVERKADDGKTLGVETRQGDNKTLGVQTQKGDGKTLGLNTRKDDGKLLGIFPAPGHKKAENRVDVDLDKSDHSIEVNTSADRDASIGAPATGEKGSAKVDAKVEHKDHSEAKTLSFNEVPQKVQDTIKAQGGTSDVKNIKRHTMNGKTAYKVEFKKEGRNTVLHIAEDGTIIKDNNK